VSLLAEGTEEEEEEEEAEAAKCLWRAAREASGVTPNRPKSYTTDMVK